MPQPLPIASFLSSGLKVTLYPLHVSFPALVLGLDRAAGAFASNSLADRPLQIRETILWNDGRPLATAAK
jgi:hypothetical protein